jgi:hypothetical protein
MARFVCITLLLDLDLKRAFLWFRLVAAERLALRYGIFLFGFMDGLGWKHGVRYGILSLSEVHARRYHGSYGTLFFLQCWGHPVYWSLSIYFMSWSER